MRSLLTVKMESLCFIICALGISRCLAETCAVFNLSANIQENIEVHENTSLTIPFELHKNNCKQDAFQNYSIYVTKVRADNKIGTTNCNIRYINGVCRPTSDDNCSCEEKPGTYLWRRNVSRRDAPPVKWVWHTSNKQAEKRELRIHVKFPARITDVRMNNSKQAIYTAEENSTVEVICFLENGSPPVTARLLDRRGVEIKGSISSTGQIRHTFAGVACQDSGPIRCEAPGASHNKSVELLVKCRPEVVSGLPKTVQTLVGESTDMTINVQSYVNITEHKLCFVQRETPQIFKCDRFKQSLTGTPPNLTLTVRLDNMTKEEEGQWRLDLTNDAGFIHRSFKLDVLERVDFEFPTLNSSVIHMNENETINLQFKLIRDHIRQEMLYMLQNYTIVVNKVSKDSKTASVCNIIHGNGKCVEDNVGPVCSCLKEHDTYNFTKTVDRSDNTKWTWSVSDKKARAKTITFDVKYPARIRGMAFDGLDRESYLADLNSTFDVICFWENGNPPVRPRLLDRHGVEINGSIHTTGQIRNSFTGVGCHDADLIHCQAPGASQNKTAKLLIKCPPQAEFSTRAVISDKSSELEIKVISYTRDLRCTISRYHSDMNATSCGENNVSLTGTPPDLTLTFRLPNVSKEEAEGHWRMTLSNDAGYIKIEFNVTVSTPDSPFISTVSTVTPITLTAVLGLGAVAAIITAIAAACVQARHMSTKKRVSRDSALIELQKRWRLNRALEEDISYSAASASASVSLYDSADSSRIIRGNDPRFPLTNAEVNSLGYTEVADPLTITKKQLLDGRTYERMNRWMDGWEDGLEEQRLGFITHAGVARAMRKLRLPGCLQVLEMAILLIMRFRLKQTTTDKERE